MAEVRHVEVPGRGPAEPRTTGPQRRLWLWSAFVIVLVGGAYLRFADLETRPLHADETTGARLLANRLEDRYEFDPTHFHGPLFGQLAAPFVRLHGEHRWEELRAETLRRVPAVASLLTLGVPLLLRRQLGLGAAVAASAFIAASPLIVFFGRTFIHESLLGLAALLAIAAGYFWCLRPSLRRAAVVGLAVGVMFALKETAAISIIAWGGAFAALALERLSWLRRHLTEVAWRRLVPQALLAGGLAFGVVVITYSESFQSPSSVVDFFRTYFVYELTEGHGKPFGYYARLLLWPGHYGRIVWSEAGVAVFASFGFIAAVRRGYLFPRWLGYATLGHLLVYSFIEYKVPWLMVVPWLHACLLAGYGGAAAFRTLLARRTVFAVALGAALAWQGWQTQVAIFRLHSSLPNPYAYVSSSADVVILGTWLRELADHYPEVRRGPIAVVGREYWPLPWYLRGTAPLGYWPEPPPGATAFPVVLAMPGQQEALNKALGGTHVSLPRGLRLNTPILVFIRKDIWEDYLP